MTLTMIITLAIVVLMVAVIISDKLPFGAPAIIACALLVVTNQADMATAFSGFTDKNVIMIMGFMVCTAALQKTTVMYNLKGVLSKVASKGGSLGFIALVVAIMAIGNFINGTAYYVLVISIVATIPYNKAMPASRLLIPAAFAPQGGWLPNSVVMFAGIIGSLLESAGVNGEISIPKFILFNVVWSVIYLVYAFVMHRFLPNRDISDSKVEDAGEDKPFVLEITKTQEKIIYVGYVILLGSMMFLSKFPGETGYGIPLLIAGVYLACGAVNFKEFLGNMFSPVLIMMASVIGVAAAMNNCGLSSFIGNNIANLLGGAPSMVALVFVFGFLTSIMATFTGASFGSLFVFAPIGIALCVGLGYNPAPLAFACVSAAWTNWFMPIDGMPALAMGTGKYKLTEFWVYVLPLWILRMVCVCAGGIFLFG